MEAYNQNDATGFIALNALRLKVAARVHWAQKQARKKWLFVDFWLKKARPRGITRLHAVLFNARISPGT